MHDSPSLPKLLAAVEQFLKDELLPQLSGDAKYQTRVSINAVGLVRRQLETEETASAAEHARLAALLQQDGSLRELNGALCSAIADGRLDLSAPGLTQHLWSTTREKLAVDQPSYLRSASGGSAS